jgi:hypothetical membrane protein
MKQKEFLHFGYISPIIFWITTIICGFMIEDYNHLKWLVSELGELGSRPQYIFTVGLVLSSFLNIFFIIGLWRYCKKQQISTIPVFFLSLYSFIAGPAIFPMPLHLHGIVGLPFPFIMLSPIFAFILWRKHEHFLRFRKIALISFITMVLGFLIYFPSILNEYFGLKQRFLYLGWTIWSVYLSYRIINIKNKLKI